MFRSGNGTRRGTKDTYQLGASNVSAGSHWSERASQSTLYCQQTLFPITPEIFLAPVFAGAECRWGWHWPAVSWSLDTVLASHLPPLPPRLVSVPDTSNKKQIPPNLGSIPSSGWMGEATLLVPVIFLLYVCNRRWIKALTGAGGLGGIQRTTCIAESRHPSISLTEDHLPPPSSPHLDAGSDCELWADERVSESGGFITDQSLITIRHSSLSWLFSESVTRRECVTLIPGLGHGSPGPPECPSCQCSRILRCHGLETCGSAPDQRRTGAKLIISSRRC